MRGQYQRIKNPCFDLDMYTYSVMCYSICHVGHWSWAVRPPWNGSVPPPPLEKIKQMINKRDSFL